jgi:hypothetical protein
MLKVIFISIINLLKFLVEIKHTIRKPFKKKYTEFQIGLDGIKFLNWF